MRQSLAIGQSLLDDDRQCANPGSFMRYLGHSLSLPIEKSGDIVVTLCHKRNIGRMKSSSTSWINAPERSLASQSFRKSYSLPQRGHHPQRVTIRASFSMLLAPILRQRQARLRDKKCDRKTKQGQIDVQRPHPHSQNKRRWKEAKLPAPLWKLHIPLAHWSNTLVQSNDHPSTYANTFSTSSTTRVQRSSSARTNNRQKTVDL